MLLYYYKIHVIKTHYIFERMVSSTTTVQGAVTGGDFTSLSTIVADIVIIYIFRVYNNNIVKVNILVNFFILHFTFIYFILIMYLYFTIYFI